MVELWSPTGKARGTERTPKRGDIPAKSWRIHPRPKAVAFCCRGEMKIFSTPISFATQLLEDAAGAGNAQH
jgi:hypothetical protein